jgi:single-stranded DNA-binding protein
MQEFGKKTVKVVDKLSVIWFAGVMPAEQDMTAQSAQSAPETPRIRVRGRIGQEAQFRVVPDKDLLVGSLSIAEHPDKDTTVWHDVAAFGERAQKLQEQFGSGELRVGQEVEVVGYVHRRERPTKEGGTRTVEQIYAATIKPVVNKPQATPEGTPAAENPQE